MPPEVLTGLQIDLFEQEAIRIEKEAENTPNAGKVSWFLQGTVCIPASFLHLQISSPAYSNVVVPRCVRIVSSSCTGRRLIVRSIESLSFKGPSATIKSE